MELLTMWRRVTARKHRRRSFYETQTAMKQAVEAEQYEQPTVPGPSGVVRTGEGAGASS